MTQTTRYTFLYVGETNNGPTPPDAAISRHQLLLCPSQPLEIGSRIFLNHVLNAPSTVPFFPTTVRLPLITFFSDVWGAVIGVNAQNRWEVEFVVENWNIDAQVKRAYVRVPRYPGISIARDIWASFMETLLERIHEVSCTTQAETYLTSVHMAEQTEGREDKPAYTRRVEHAITTSPDLYTPTVEPNSATIPTPPETELITPPQWEDKFYVWIPEDAGRNPERGSLEQVSAHRPFANDV
ncbi:hypothetical protein VTO73DRAFT_12866 [Trametes versicolor]